jgi:hypothetical protein
VHTKHCTQARIDACAFGRSTLRVFHARLIPVLCKDQPLTITEGNQPTTAQKMTEDLLSGMVKTICGSYKITYHPQGPDGPPMEIDFTPPFKRYSMMSTLEEKLGVKMPDPTTLETEEARKCVRRKTRNVAYWQCCHSRLSIRASCAYHAKGRPRVFNVVDPRICGESSHARLAVGVCCHIAQNHG